jgi:hypothetical protein
MADFNENYFVTLVKNVQHKISDGFFMIMSNFTDYIAKDSFLKNISPIAPYGYGSLAPKNSNVLVIPVYGTNQHNVSVGVQMTMPPIPTELKDGCAWLHSKKYVLTTENTKINGYRAGDDNFFATLPNGQFVGTMILNALNALQAEIDYLKTHKHLAGDYIANGSPVIGSSGVPTSMPPQPASIATDKEYINSGKYLIDDNGVMYGE